MIETALIAAVIVLPIILANLGEKNEAERTVTYILLGLLCAGLIIMGLGVIIGGLLFSTSEYFDNIEAGSIILYGILFVITGAVSGSMLLKPIRIQIAKYMDINPQSCVHTTGLILISVLTGVLVITVLFMFMGGYELFEELVMEEETTQTDTVSNVSAMVVQEVFFVVLAFISVGVLIRRNLKDSLKRLGLVAPTLKQILIGFGAVFILFAVAVPIGLLMDYYTPESSELIDKVMQGFLGNINIYHALILAISAGVGEEILFRGAIQPRFGIPFTAFLFAMVHVQYPNLLAILMLFVVGVILGILRKKTNTVVPIITHATYDFIVFLAFIFIS